MKSRIHQDRDLIISVGPVSSYRKQSLKFNMGFRGEAYKSDNPLCVLFVSSLKYSPPLFPALLPFYVSPCFSCKIIRFWVLLASLCIYFQISVCFRSERDNKSLPWGLLLAGVRAAHMGSVCPTCFPGQRSATLPLGMPELPTSSFSWVSGYRCFQTQSGQVSPLMLMQ